MDTLDISGEMLFNARMNEEVETKSVFPHLRSVRRISRIPVVETTWDYASGVYTKIKGSNRLIAWGLGTAESSVQVAVTISRPFVNVFEKPIGLVDGLVCKSLDLVEEKVPVITFPPELIVVSTKEYVTNNIVRPVLKRADSLKQIGVEKATHALDNKYAAFAATHIDTALEVADRYIDQYLPDSAENKESPSNGLKEIGALCLVHFPSVRENLLKSDAGVPAMNDVGSNKAIQTLHHADQVTRKLQRRLSQRTMQELQALKQGGEETIQALLYVLELYARDPKAAQEKARELWATLSENEPNNVLPPANLEEWLVILTRRFTRRMVHLVNYIRTKRVDERTGKEIKPENLEQWLYMKTHETVVQLADIVHVVINLPSNVSLEKLIPFHEQTISVIRKFMDSMNSYMKTTVVQPVLKRTNSIKQFSLEKANHILDSKYAEFAADRLESALDVADKYIDQYLPDDLPGQYDPPATNDIGGSKAKQTINHVDKFSRKLQRRLTQRTLIEAKAFKQGGQDTLQYMLFLAELFARDPKAVYQMALDLWATLSKDEPENQVPPANLEQLTVMLIRETARRIVHLMNYTGNGVVQLPQRVSILMHTLLIYSSQLTDMLLKAVRFEEAKYMVISEANSQIAHIRKLLDEINDYITHILERVAGNGRPVSKREKESASALNVAQILEAMF
ncbi:uncharacterized protein [Anabrus simplex]|uniref:uncharacterized protein isoform X1 n=1 Tax=Anabrus simplex TaxID=316456 RepID=UPI0035A3A5E4